MPTHTRLVVSLLAACALPAAAQDIQPFRAQDVRPVQAQEVKPSAPAQEVRPVQAQPVQPRPPAPQVRGAKAPTPAQPAAAARPSALFGRWRTRIPGGVWQSPSPVPGYDVLNVSTGARAGDLIIRPDGTYVWQSYGGKSGRWEPGDAEHPVVLVDTSEGKRWRVRLDPKRENGRELIIWGGGSFNYEGRR